MSKNNLKKNTLLFICSPSLGIIDSWLPVLQKIKEIDPKKNIVCVFTKNRMIHEIETDKSLIQIADKTFDKTVFYSSIQKWIIADNFSETKEFEKRNLIQSFLHKVTQRLPKNRLFSYPKRFLNSINSSSIYFRMKNNIFKWEDNSENVTSILFDVYVDKKDHVTEILNHFKHVQKFSMSHGLKVKNINLWSDQKTPVKDDVIAYIHSKHESGFFRDRFGIPEKNQRVIGVPRHDPEWIQHLIDNDSELESEIGNDFIFVISRPHTTDYHPRERMEKSLEHIKKLAWDYLDKKLVVKLHPKEKVTGIYEEVFGEENYGSKWVYSNAHPLILGSRCSFAIAFYSGVVVDMTAIEIPTIELLDLRGIKGYDDDEALRDENGDPVFEYRFNDLTLGANDYEDLKKQTDRILNNRPEVMKYLKEGYLKFYETSENVRNRIATDILGN